MASSMHEFFADLMLCRFLNRPPVLPLAHECNCHVMCRGWHYRQRLLIHFPVAQDPNNHTITIFITTQLANSLCFLLTKS